MGDITQAAVDAARFYRDLREEAFKEVASIAKTRDNEGIQLGAVLIKDDFLTGGSKVSWEISLAGRNYKGISEVSNPTESWMTSGGIFEGVVKAILEDMGEKLRDTLVQQSYKYSQRR